MRPVDKGNAPKAYTEYKQARHDLANQIGYYCSYCEMSVRNMIEVEHIHPQANGGASLDWDNFLLSCRYCNGAKSNNNSSRKGYLWPDIDNTDLVFSYSEIDIIKPQLGLPPAIYQAALATINLMGLNRAFAPNLPYPTEANTRWITRIEAWNKAKRSLTNWTKNPSREMAELIGIAATKAHFSIWCTVFANQPQVIKAIVAEYKGTYTTKDQQGIRKIRPKGII